MLTRLFIIFLILQFPRHLPLVTNPSPSHPLPKLQDCNFPTNLFNIARGTKQGDPISPYLFILVIEILASLVRQNRQIEGIWIGEKHKKLELFADDSTFFLKDIASLNAVLKSIQEFYLFSSLKINTTKSEAGWIGSSKTRCATYQR